MRIIERLRAHQLGQRLNGAYRRLLTGTDDSKLILRDIVSFSEIIAYRDAAGIDKDTLLVMEGRRQMAVHILRHLDLKPEDFIEVSNDAHAMFAYADNGDINEE